MNRQVRSFCAGSVIFFLVFTLLSPDDALCFDTDTLKTTGIIMGITFGVALVIVLVVGTIRDVKGRPDGDQEEDDVWSKHPALRTLGYRPVYFPLLGEAPSPPEDLSKEGRGREMEIEAFLQGKVDAIGLGSLFDRSLQDPCPFTSAPCPEKSPSRALPRPGRRVPLSRSGGPMTGHEADRDTTMFLETHEKAELPASDRSLISWKSRPGRRLAFGTAPSYNANLNLFRNKDLSGK